EPVAEDRAGGPAAVRRPGRAHSRPRHPRRCRGRRAVGRAPDHRSAAAHRRLTLQVPRRVQSRPMLALALAASLFASTPETIRVSPGTHEVLKVPGLTKVAVSKPEIADVQVTGQGELLVLGHQHGKATLTVWANGK